MSNEQTNHSEQINELAAALATAQGKFQPIKKSKTVEVNGKTRDGRDFKYKYAYAPLDEILNATRPALSENGLAIIQTTDEGDYGTLLKTSLIHASGQWYNSYKILGRFEDPQKFGGALTYYRRYEISTVLGISSEEDDDANGVTGNEVQHKQKPANRSSVDADKEVQPPKPAPQANGVTTNTKPTDKGKPPTTGEELLALVNDRVLVTYDSVNHLRNAIRIISKNQKWNWPRPDDREAWGEAFKLAKQYAEAKTTEQLPIAEEEVAF